MDLLKKLTSKNIKRLPSYLLGLFIGIIVILALIICANNLMQYISVKRENEKLIYERENILIKVEELKYYVNTEMDDEYKERMARLMGYCFPDENIYYVE
jgi:hypothetical protein